ncbi:MAG: hypothetical protein ACI4JG_00445 [Acutalibacteraceae bacterium]
MELSNAGILDKVRFLLSLAQKNQYTKNELEAVTALLSEHSESMRLGKVFGYSVSDYAFATLSWLSTDETKELFDCYYSQLSAERKQTISQLIDNKLYLQF